MEVATDPSSDNDEKILLEPGGAFLYPKLEFPEAEAGTVSIDMSFNSDILLEDYTTGDLGMESSGNLLDEESGSAGTGPVRYISLEEDTQGPNHQYESIPIVDAYVALNLLDSMRYGLITEDGLDDLVLEDNQDLDVLLMEDHTSDKPVVVLKEDGSQLLSETGTERPFERRRLIIEQFPITDGSFAPVIQYANHISTSILDRFLYEDGDILEMEDNSQLIQEGDPSVRAADKEYEFSLFDTVNWHILTEDESHLIVEGDETSQRLSRFISEEFSGPKVDAVDILIDGTSMDGYAGTARIGDHHHEQVLYNHYDTQGRAITSTVGLQVCRPHFISQWPSAGLGFVDDRWTMEDDTGLILLEHPVVSTDYLISEDLPGASGDLFDTYTKQSWTVLPAYQYSRVLTPLTGTITFADEGTTGTGTGTSFTTQLRVGDEFQTQTDNIISEETSDGILFETDERLEYEQPIISDVANVVLNSNNSEILNMPIDTLKWFFASEDSTVAAHPDSNHTNVLGQYADDLIDFSQESFWFLTDDSYGRGRLISENIMNVPINIVQDYALTTDLLAIVLEDWHWDFTTEDSVTPASSGASLQQGTFAEYDNSGTGPNYESTWIILDEESNATSGNHTIGQETNTTRVEDGDAIISEAGEEANINMIWEDFSKQLITEPQAFIVGAITNDTSLTVTRKHLGGTENSIIRM